MGVRLRRLREEHGLTQAALARQLGLSASYFNQIEQNQRPMTLALLLRLGAALDIDVQSFSEDEETRMVSALGEVFANLPASAVGRGTDDAHVSQAEIREIAASMPAVGRAFIQLHRRHREAVERLEALSETLGAQGQDGTGQAGMQPLPYEEVRDFFFTHHNHFAELDMDAERCFSDWGLHGLPPLRLADRLAERLQTRHGIAVRYTEGIDQGLGIAGLHPEDGLHESAQAWPGSEPLPPTGQLALAQHLDPGQHAFQMAQRLALLERGGVLERMADDPRFSGEQGRRLVRSGLASYFAAALLLPYGRFLEAAEALHYDIDLLGQRFGVSFETVCHRLSTMQRPHATGVPFFFIRVDRAGNISKRQSATHFHFSRVGGTCPLWNVYEAFSHPGRILRQLARMPDGRTYLLIARTVIRRTPGFGEPDKVFAVALGCDVAHAHRLVYAKGLDLLDPAAATPIGMGCKVCERPACPQRAFPYIGRMRQDAVPP